MFQHMVLKKTDENLIGYIKIFLTFYIKIFLIKEEKKNIWGELQFTVSIMSLKDGV